MREGKINVVMMIMRSPSTKILSYNILHCVAVRILLYTIFLKDYHQAINPVINEQEFGTEMDSVMRSLDNSIIGIESQGSSPKLRN